MRKNSCISGFVLTCFLSSLGAAEEAVQAPTRAHETTGEAIAAAMMAACPQASPSDETARQKCAAGLGADPLLDSVMDEPFLWGGQGKEGNYDVAASNLTRFNPFVWRRMYLSLFMFSGPPRIERQGATTIVHLPGAFRNELDAGSYPYPFWHSEKKWHSYQVSTELLLIVSDGKLRAAMRAATRDEARPQIARIFDGHWTWAEGQEPRNTLYRSLFSTANPHVARVDTAFRRLEKIMRAQGCQNCHSPNNAMGMNPLELLTYPNQALAARHRIVEQIEGKKMPPEKDGESAGIQSPAERRKALAAARAFERAADAALEYEQRKSRQVAGAGSLGRP